MSSPDISYLNHAGTSWPKPDVVIHAARSAMESSPDQWPTLFDTSAGTVADFFHVDRQRLLFTPSCTAALNLAISGLPWQHGDRVLTSLYEHHALRRNLLKLQHLGVEVVPVDGSDNSLVDLEQLQMALRSSRTRLVAMTAASNVTGQLLPMQDVVNIAHDYGALVLIDGAQIAGWWDLDLRSLGADLFVFAGHKGLQSPTGVGGLYVAPEASMMCPTAACDIAGNLKPHSTIPGYCDAGSVNYAALAGLAAGCEWLSHTDHSRRLDNARTVAESLLNRLRERPDVRIYHAGPVDCRMPTVAFTVHGTSNAQIRDRLRAAGITAAVGFQCAPQAHDTLGTQREGVVRVSFGPETPAHSVERLIQAVFHCETPESDQITAPGESR